MLYDKCIQDFVMRAWKEEHLEDLGVDGTTVDLNETGREDADCTHLVVDQSLTLFDEHNDESSFCVRGGEFIE
jgi:hypothetical protein